MLYDYILYTIYYYMLYVYIINYILNRLTYIIQLFIDMHVFFRISNAILFN